jgi:large subunit ribosomal protein L29
MRVEEIRAMTDENLKVELEATQKELFNLRFQKATQQLSDTTGIRKAKRKVARIKTIMRERQLAGTPVTAQG